MLELSVWVVLSFAPEEAAVGAGALLRLLLCAAIMRWTCSRVDEDFFKEVMIKKC